MSFWEWLKRLFSRVEKWVDQIGEPAIKFLEKIKVAINNPAADILVDLTVTDIDNQLLKFFRENLPKVIEQLGLWNDHNNPDTDIQLFVSHLRNKPEAYQEAILHKTASLLSEKYLQSKESKNTVRVKRYDTDTLTHIAYGKFKEK